MSYSGILSHSTSASLQEDVIMFVFASGFKDPIIERMNVSSDFESSGVFTNFVLETSSLFQAILANQTHEKKGEILKAINEAAIEYDDSTRKVSFDNETILIVGKK